MQTYTSDNLTPWYPPEIKPVRSGVYQRNFDTTGMGEPITGYSKYFEPLDVWFFYANTVEEADKETVISSVYDLPWRGLNAEF